MMKQLRLLAVMMVLSVELWAQQAMTREMYIDTFYMTAVREMNAYGIPASITIAQGILESGNGNSRLAVEANNHFGIKCHKGWEGPSIRHDDDALQECFRKYENADESYRDHSLFLTSRDRYASLFELRPTDYKAWARGLKKAGYATSPTYARRLIELIEDNHLYVFDTMNYERLLAEKGIEHKEPLGESKDLVAREDAQEKHEQKVKESKKGRLEILMHKNRIKYVIAREGDDLKDIVRKTNVWDWEIRRYNNLKDDKIEAGQTVFLQPLRRRGYTSFHKVQEGDTLEQIAQTYGIKVKWILKRSRLTADYVPQAGDTLWLRGWKKK